MFLCSQIRMLLTNPQSDGFWKRVLWELIRSGGQNDDSDMNDNSALLKESPALHSPFLPCEDPARDSCVRTRKQVHIRHRICWCLDLRLPSPQNCQK